METYQVKMYYIKKQASSVPLNLRISPSVQNQLEKLSRSTGRTKSYLVSEAIELYLATQAWQIKAIEETVQKADAKNAKIYEHKNVSEWLNNWGTDDERDFLE